MDLIIFERKAFEEFATKIEQFILRVSNSPVVKSGKKKTNNCRLGKTNHIRSQESSNHRNRYHYRIQKITRYMQRDSQRSNNKRKFADLRYIFFQRPLKSQKGSVGRCTFEKGKSRWGLALSSEGLFTQFTILTVSQKIIVHPEKNWR